MKKKQDRKTNDICKKGDEDKQKTKDLKKEKSEDFLIWALILDCGLKWPHRSPAMKIPQRKLHPPLFFYVHFINNFMNTSFTTDLVY